MGLDRGIGHGRSSARVADKVGELVDEGGGAAAAGGDVAAGAATATFVAVGQASTGIRLLDDDFFVVNATRFHLATLRIFRCCVLGLILILIWTVGGGVLGSVIAGCVWPLELLFLVVVLFRRTCCCSCGCCVA